MGGMFRKVLAVTLQGTCPPPQRLHDLPLLDCSWACGRTPHDNDTGTGGWLLGTSQ